MASIRHSLQKEVFDISEEKLIEILNVTKPGKKKKKTSFLCTVINKEQPVSAFIYQVKETDKDLFKKKLSWPLLGLQIVDGKDEVKETAELDLTFDRTFKWNCSSVPEKHAFIKVLWKLCCRYLPTQKPHFINVPLDLIREDSSQTEGKIILAPNLASVDSEEEVDFCALSEREQYDLEQLMLQVETAVSNAEAFAEQLSKDLSMLDGANIQSMMASEVQVEALMKMIDAALDEAEKIEKRLNHYDETLLLVKDSMDKMAEKNFFIEQTNSNNRQLLTTLDHVIKQLHFPQEYETYLTNPGFQANSLDTIIKAANALEIATKAPIPPHLLHLQAVKEQQRRFERLQSEFSKHLARNLNNLFIYHGNESGELNSSSEKVTLPRHNRIHEQLMPYAPLMHWMRALDSRVFRKLKESYSGSISKLYERNMKIFFDDAKQCISGGKRLRGSGSSQDIASMAGKLSSLSTRTTAGVAGALLGIDRDQWGVELDQHERQSFDQIFEQLLSELEPVCLAEQEFCCNFFNLSAPMDLYSKPSSNVSTPGSNTSEESGGSADSSRQQGQKHVNKDVRLMMAELFTNLEHQLTSFVNTFYKADSYCCLYIYVRLSDHVLSAEDTGSFLCISFGSCLVQAKRNYDNFMTLQLNSIKECKISRKKCGILPFITNFESFAKTAESVFKQSDRRGDLDKWYNALIMAMFEHIPRIAVEHQRTPEEVIKMENYHFLHQLLSQLKLPGLENQRKEAKQRYQDALNAYVTQYFGRPLEKLNLFFEGVTSKVASGVKESEVGYQLAFNKQELRKVIKEYPGKEVNKGLEQLYKKVEKHLCEEGNLLQVVWRAMQREFISQYKHIEDLIHRCYPGAMVTLDFSIEDILNYFSDIALSH